MPEDDLVAKYAAEAKAAMAAEANRRIEEKTDPEEENDYVQHHYSNS